MAVFLADRAVRKLVDSAFEGATEILTTHRKLMSGTATKLPEKEALSADELPDLRLENNKRKPV